MSLNDGLTDEQKWIIEEIKEHLPFILEHVPNPDKSRALLGMAYEYFLMDMEDEAYALLLKADPEYFKDQLKEDMVMIPNMRQIVFRIMGKLVELGLVKVVTDEED